jgi:lysophospholipase L1-like esterase
MFKRFSFVICAAASLTFATASLAQSRNDLDEHTRILALGDSLTAGIGAMPATEGYAYLLYRDGVYDRVANTNFANAAMPGATSDEVLKFETPLATQAGFLLPPIPDEATPHNPPRIVVMTVGGNDLLSLFNPLADAATAIAKFSANMVGVFAQLCRIPNTRIYAGNMYNINTFPAPPSVPVGQIVNAFNKALADVVTAVNAGGAICPNNVKVADVYSQFLGDQSALLLINRKGADKFEVHPTNAGHRAIERAFILAK